MARAKQRRAQKAKANPAVSTAPAPTSALIKPSRKVPPKTSLFLYVRAGGCCEFDGCNKYLLEHGPTAIPGNFAEQAHIWAFNTGGARGKAAGRPADINALSNLMLLCGECHHLVDDVRPQDFPVEVLRKFKQDHEARVYELMRLSKDRQTVPLILKAPVAGRLMDISDEEMQRAVAPNLLCVRQKIEIDLSSLPDTAGAAYWQSAREAMTPRLDELGRLEPQPGRALRVSVFALAPIPLLVDLGSRLSDKYVVELYQRHRQPETWNWHEDVGVARFDTRCVVQGGDTVALLVNVSGANTAEHVVNTLGPCTVYELAVRGQAATPLILRTRSDLDQFVAAYVQALALIRTAHPQLPKLHLFPAVPAPVGIALGRSRLPKVDPPLLVYDRDQRAGGFVPTLEVT